MHNNYYFLRQLSTSLEKILAGTVISECFSQNKDELIIRFETAEKPFFIKASLLPTFSCLSFPDNFHRARKNSADIFEGLVGQRVSGVRQFKNERSFALQFSNDVSLLFKMHGNRANVIYFEGDNPVSLFRNNIKGDDGIVLNSLDRKIDWSYENFLAHQDKWNEIYFTFGKVMWHYLEDRNFSSKPIEKKWEAIQEALHILENPTFYICEFKNSAMFTLFPIGNIQKEFSDPIKAVNEFFYTYIQTHAFTHEKTSALSTLKAKLTSSYAYTEKTRHKLNELKTDNNYKVWADLIMANLHTIPIRAEHITLNNFYHDNHPTEIKLKKDLSPQKNAEIFYKKSKNQLIELQRLDAALEAKNKEIELLLEKIKALDASSDLKSLRTLTPHEETEKEKAPRPFHEFEFKGFKIWVGKNAKANDELTLKYAYKEDLWLHAKDVAGSHVIVKHQAGKKIPNDVIERAAQLAAYNSKRKTETLCPVVFTAKKFVRKRKGDLPGAVVVEKEEVIMVEPKLLEKKG